LQINPVSSLAMSVQKSKKKADRNILAITDFSKSSTNAILFASRLFEDSNLKFKLLNVFENPNEKATLLISVEDILTKDSEAGLEKQSTEIATLLKSLKFKISTHSHQGRLKKAISTIAQTENVDLLVAGISSDKYPCKNFNNTPLLFMGQSKFPILIVPEKCSDKAVNSVLILNLDAHLPKNILEKGFESIINHDHIAKYTISLNEKKIDAGTLSHLNSELKEHAVNLIIIIPTAGDKIDRAMLDYQIKELCPSIASLLNC
jgi:nucleotide-binding universal stress UspA family protein